MVLFDLSAAQAAARSFAVGRGSLWQAGPAWRAKPWAVQTLLVALLAVTMPTPVLADPMQPGVKAGVDAWSRKDYATAVRDWQSAAAKGDPDAEFDLGQAYKLGHGVPQDFTRAEQLFGQAAAQGHMQAADNYGLLLFQRGQHAQAMPYIQAAAGRGDPRAEYLLGIAYFNADVVTQDWVRAYAYASLAQQAGLPQAKAALAQMDSYIPLEQRQQGVAMASDLAAQAEATRQRQVAAADLGTAPTQAAPPAVPPGAYAPSPPAAAPAPDMQPAPEQAATPEPAPPPAGQQLQPRPRPAPAEDSAPAEAASSGDWKIQLGAFGVAANAEAQWNRVKDMPGVAGHARQMAPSGRVTRLLATGYAEADAKATCARLAAAGIACLPTRN